MQTVVPLRGIAAAGFATDPRSERAYDWLLGERHLDGSWPAGPKARRGRLGWRSKFAAVSHSCRALRITIFSASWRKEPLVPSKLFQLRALRGSTSTC